MCTSCVAGSALLQSYCVPQPCPLPYFINSSASCVLQCTPGQYVHEPARVCYDQCPDELVTSGRACVDSCQPNEFINHNQAC